MCWIDEKSPQKRQIWRLFAACLFFTNRMIVYLCYFLARSLGYCMEVTWTSAIFRRSRTKPGSRRGWYKFYALTFNTWNVLKIHSPSFDFFSRSHEIFADDWKRRTGSDKSNLTTINQFIHDCSLFYICDFFMCWMKNFLFAAPMANLSAVKREVIAFKPTNHCHHSMIMIHVDYVMHWKWEVCSFGRWSWPFSTDKPSSRTDRGQANWPVFY